MHYSGRGIHNEDRQNAGNPHRSRSGVNIAFRNLEQVVPCDVRTHLDLYRDSIKRLLKLVRPKLPLSCEGSR